MHGGAAISTTELVLTAVFVLALLIAPSIAWLRFLRERVWQNTPRAIEVAARLRRILVVGLCAYGVTRSACASCTPSRRTCRRRWMTHAAPY